MNSSDEKKYLERIAALEADLANREQDLMLFREEISQLNEHLSDFITQVTHELRMAQTIQKSLVPTEIPNIPGFEFSTKYEASAISGGDYFDIFELSDKYRFGIVLSSSSGHGMSALFLSVLLRLTGQIEARLGRSPHEVLRLMAKELDANIQGDETASVFYAVIDRRRFEMEHCQVGDLMVLYHHSETDKLERFDSKAPAFFKGFHSDLKTQTQVLNPRDRLVLCSPGLVKVLNPSNEPFGEERLFKIILGGSKLHAHELRNEILFHTNQFAAGREIERDLTLMVVDVQDKVIKLARP